MINQPRILLGDEPTGALDSTSAAEIMNILSERNAEGMTIVLVTHDTRVAARTARVLSLVDGCIVGDRRQSHASGDDLDQRHHDLTAWLLQHGNERCSPRGLAGPCGPMVPA